MKKNKIFVACDTTNLNKINKIITETKSSNLKVGYKFGLEFLNSKNGRTFVSRIKNKTRVRLLIKSNKMTKISQIEVRDWLKNITVPNNIYFSVDIDPYNFY